MACGRLALQFLHGTKAREAIASRQSEVSKIEDLFNKRSRGFVNRNGADHTYMDPHKTRTFFWTTCIPQVQPFQKSSNPFCPLTQNQTGWREYIEHKNVRHAVRPRGPKDLPHRVQHTMEPRPRCWKHVVSGTDDTVPIFPSQS